MTLKECEEKLSCLDNEISILLKKRENILKEWNICFENENQDRISCVDEYTGIYHKLFLVNGSSTVHVCDICDDDFRKNINEYYKIVDNSLRIYSIARGLLDGISEVQKNFVYAKAAEIRREYLKSRENKVIDIRNRLDD